MNVGQPLVASAVSKRQFLVIESHLVQDRRVQVVEVDRVFDDRLTDFVGRAVHRSFFDAAAREPVGETFREVIASVAVLRIRSASMP